MKVPAPNQSNFKPVPEGIHSARIFQVADLGTQESTYQGETSKKRQVRITLELLGPDCFLDDGRPMALSVVRTMSLHENSRLRKDLEAIRGKGYTTEELDGVDLVKLAGAFCKVFVAHTPKGDGVLPRVGIDRFLKWPPNEEKPSGVNVITIFDFDEPSIASLERLPEWCQESIKKSPEYSAWASSKDAPQFDDGIDF
jgi:hypothetical protein